MMTRLRLTNFKAWRELQVRFATVTGVFGANSAGKSSLLQFLLLKADPRCDRPAHRAGLRRPREPGESR